MLTKVDCGDYALISGDITQSLQWYFRDKNHDQVFIICDQNTHGHCLPLLPEEVRKTARTIRIPAGESYKHLKTCRLIWEDMIQAGITRNSLVINLGGGVICDMGGFCASVFMRGVPFINIPTSLLAMVDASIGGKLAVDFDGLKNYIGLFSDPKAILLDSKFLETLPVEELESGFAEIIKHALIADQQLWDYIKSEKLKPEYLNSSDILQFAEIKTKIVEADPQEKDIRKALNFGHTIGHALETLVIRSGKMISHGHAVALGIIVESFISYKKGFLLKEELNEITGFIRGIFPSSPVQHFEKNAIIKLTTHDKKNFGTKPNYTLLDGIGGYFINEEVEEDMVNDALDYLVS